MGPDVAGIWSALANLPGRSPQDQRLDRLARQTYRSVDHNVWSFRVKRWRITSFRDGRVHSASLQPRDTEGRFL